MSNQDVVNQAVVKFNDKFFLKHESNKYLIAVEQGRYNWPKLSQEKKKLAKLELVGDNGELQANSRIKIRTTESAIGDNNILGAFADSHDCYYWQDGYDEDKQSWQITKADGDASPIRYGDRVRITNISYSNQSLALDTKYDGYITTVENASDSWILAPATVEASFRGLDDTGRHDPEEISDGEDDDDDAPTWF
ncbi:MAG: hypothetical protein V7L29_31220 [Nostoc sp.]|uniref:hypothetical protein n=1 Tax=Nostoc sp. TaxID=1180 RepID=UPI002FF5ECB1